MSACSVFLYLGMAWLVLLLLPLLATALPQASAVAMVLIVAGVLIYSGSAAFIHTRARHWPFHNALWHAMVPCAAGLHMAAIAQVISLPVVP